MGNFALPVDFERRREGDIRITVLTSIQLNTFPLDFQVESLEELRDGLVLSKALGN